jgi:hypothetical protein
MQPNTEAVGPMKPPQGSTPIAGREKLGEGKNRENLKNI